MDFARRELGFAIMRNINFVRRAWFIVVMGLILVPPLVVGLQISFQFIRLQNLFERLSHQNLALEFVDFVACCERKLHKFAMYLLFTFVANLPRANLCSDFVHCVV